MKSNLSFLSAFLFCALTACGPMQRPVDSGTRAVTVSTACDPKPADLPNQRISAPGWDGSVQGMCPAGAYSSRPGAGPLTVSSDVDQAAIGTTIVYGCAVYSSGVDLRVLLVPSASGSRDGTPSAPKEVTFPKSGKDPSRYCVPGYVLKGSKGTLDFRLLGSAESPSAGMPAAVGVHRIFTASDLPASFSLAGVQGRQPG